MNEVWHAQWHCHALSSPVLAAIICWLVRGSGWRRCLTRALRGGSTRAGLPDRDSGLRVHAAGNDQLTAVGQWIRRAS